MSPSSSQLLRATILIAGLSVAPMDTMAEERAVLRFDWPDDLSGRATITVGHTLQQNTEPMTEWEGRSSVRFSVSPTADDLLLVFEGGTIDVVTNTNSGAKRPFSDIALSMGLRRPDYRISRDGKFLALEHPVEFLRSIDPEIDTLIAEFRPDDLEILRPAIADALNRDQLEFNAGTRWNEEVGLWLDREVGPGKPILSGETINLWNGGDYSFPARVSYRLVGRTSCDDGGDDTCVELERRAVTDGAAAIAAYARVLRSAGSDIEVRRFDLVTTTRVTTDPDTLVPYQSRVDWVQTIDLLTHPTSTLIRQSGFATVTYDYD